MDRQQLGRDAESRGATLLEAAGLRVLTRNYRCRSGELDIVASDGRVLVVAEVRMRSSQRFGGAAASITWRKRQRIVRATRHLLATHPEWAAFPVRFDALIAGADSQPLQWIRSAFDAA
jgi:putative endonuclease